MGQLAEVCRRGLALARGRLQSEVLLRQPGDALRLLQVGDLRLQQTDTALFVGDAGFGLGDVGALSPGEGLGKVEADHQHQQQARAQDVDQPDAAHASPEDGCDHAAFLQAGADVRIAALSLADRARGLAAISAAEGGRALLNSRLKVGSGPAAVGGR